MGERPDLTHNLEALKNNLKLNSMLISNTVPSSKKSNKKFKHPYGTILMADAQSQKEIKLSP